MNMVDTSGLRRALAPGGSVERYLQQKAEAEKPKEIKKTMDFMQKNPNIKIGDQDQFGASAIQRRFQGIKNAAVNRSNAAQTDASNAITRKFASQGMVGSGADIKAQEMLQDQFARQKEDALAQIDAAEDQSMGRGLQAALAQADLDFKNRIFSFDQGSKMHELDLAERQLQMDAASTEFNKNMAEQMARPKGGLLSGIIDGLL